MTVPPSEAGRSAVDASPRYLAVGRPAGVDRSVGPEPLYSLTIDGRDYHLPLTGYHYWVGALAGATTADLHAIAETADDLADFADNLAWFQETHLLWASTGTLSDARDFAQLRVLPTGLGAGQTDPTTSHCSLLTRDGHPALTLDVVSYIFWTLCDGIRSVAAACDETARRTEHPLTEVQRHAAALLPRLAAHGLILLDWIDV